MSAQTEQIRSDIRRLVDEEKKLKAAPSPNETALRAKLTGTARHLPFPASDVGAGLVQAP